MTVDGSHVHARWQPEDAERGAEPMIGVRKNGELEMKLRHQRLRNPDRLHADRDDVRAEPLNQWERCLQFDQLLLTRPSPGAFVEVQHDLGSMEPLQLHLAARRGR